jgi:hypothetical protein
MHVRRASTRSSRHSTLVDSVHSIKWSHTQVCAWWVWSPTTSITTSPHVPWIRQDDPCILRQGPLHAPPRPSSSCLNKHATPHFDHTLVHAQIGVCVRRGFCNTASNDALSTRGSQHQEMPCFLRGRSLAQCPANNARNEASEYVAHPRLRVTVVPLSKARTLTPLLSIHRC